MGKISVELTEEEMRNLAEVSAMALTMLGQGMPESRDPRVDEWHRLLVDILKAAHTIPGIAKDMEMNPDCGYWFFKHAYVDSAFYSDLLDEVRDAVFWEELVARMAAQSLAESIGPEAVDNMDPEERSARLSSMEKALWNEVTRHGIDRLFFMLPPEES
ncbi:MAG: hypothetical protein Q4C88_02630 [Akkermansia sp.]|nr:hypothetical protein [Akkermansia sp.]